MTIKNHSSYVGLSIVVFILVVIVHTPSAVQASIDFVIGGHAGACVSPDATITGGCQKLIGSALGVIYTDSAGNTIRIKDVSSSNRARLEFVEGSVEKLILTGAVIEGAGANGATNVTIQFSHVGITEPTNATQRGRNRVSGIISLKSPNLEARTVTARGFAELCPSGVCATLNEIVDGVGVTVSSGTTFQSFTPLPEEENIAGATSPVPKLVGQITISRLNPPSSGSTIIDKVTNLSHSIFLAVSLPPYDTGSTACDDESDVGRIVRLDAGDPTQDRICLQLPDTVDSNGAVVPGDIVFLTGEEAVTLFTPQCPLSPPEEHHSNMRGANPNQ